MKKKKEKRKLRGCEIPKVVLEESGLEAALTMTPYQGVLVVENTQRTVYQFLQSLEALEQHLVEGYEWLVERFYSEEEDKEAWKEVVEDAIEVPDWAVEEGGFPLGTRFCLVVPEEGEYLRLEPVEYQHHIGDLSASMRLRLASLGISVERMNQSILAEESMEESMEGK